MALGAAVLARYVRRSTLRGRAAEIADAAVSVLGQRMGDGLQNFGVRGAVAGSIV